MERWSEDTTFKFVSEYVKQSCLWDSKSYGYKNKQIRLAAYSKIEEIMGLPGFGLREITQKIKNIRSTYLQELKKIRESKKSGAGTDDVYTPSLKWFSILDNVLKLVVETTKNKQTNLEITENTTQSVRVKQSPASDITEEQLTPITRSQTPVIKNATNKRKRIEEFRSIVTDLKEISDSIKIPQEENEFQLFGRHVGVQLQGMPLALALQAQSHIQTYLSRLRLQHLQHSSRSKVPRETSASPDNNYCFSSVSSPGAVNMYTDSMSSETGH